MLTIRLQSKETPAQGDAWLGRHVDLEAETLVIKESARVYKPNGDLLLALLKRGLSARCGQAMYQAVRARIGRSANRGYASGEHRRHKKLKNGLVSRTDEAAPVQSGIIGFFDRYPRIPFCRQAQFNADYPQSFDACLPAIRQADRLFKQHLPERWAAQMAVARRTSRDFVIPGTVFTTLTVNKNFRTACHRDAGDLPEGFGVMSYFRSGSFTGGDLVFPEYRVAAQLDSLDVILFDPHEVHGNTKIVPLCPASGYERITAVHYYRKDMVYCGSAAQELELAKQHDARKGTRRMKEDLHVPG